MKKYKHSKEFYDKNYKEYSTKVITRGGTPVSRVNFEYAWNFEKNKGSKNVAEKLVYSTLFNTGYNTAIAERTVLKSMGIDVKLVDLKKISTQDFAKLYRSQIDAYYNDQLSRGLNTYQAKQEVSRQFFGSK